MHTMHINMMDRRRGNEQTKRMKNMKSARPSKSQFLLLAFCLVPCILFGIQCCSFASLHVHTDATGDDPPVPPQRIIRNRNRSTVVLVLSNRTNFQPPSTEQNVVFLVVSGRGNFERRTAIRETWGFGHDNVYFVVGAACPVHPNQRTENLRCEVDPKKMVDHDEYTTYLEEEDNALTEEQAEYQDMIFTPKEESYRSLPRKLKEAYAWTIQHTQARWIVKLDDDFFVKIDAVTEYLKSHDDSVPFVVGRIMPKSRVMRKGKWAEFDFDHKFYPRFPLGSCGHAVSRPAVEYVVANKDSLFEYQGEDTSLGIWLDKAGFEVKWLTTPVFDNSRRCLSNKYYVIGHGIGPEQMRKCHTKSAVKLSL
jgi:hypothetical protein